MKRSRPWTRGLAGLLVLSMGAGATQALAAEVGAEAPVKAKTLAAAAEAKLAALDTAAALATTQAATASQPPPSKGFFKTPTGVIALVLFAGAAAWTVESRINNAVHSPARK